MKTSEFDFKLPENLIAQAPLAERDQSRLLLCKSSGRLGENKKIFKIEDLHFKDLTKILNSNDVLILNNAKVIPVRLFGKREDTNGSVEVVLLKKLNDMQYMVIAQMTSKIKPAMIFKFEPNLRAEILSTHEERTSNNGEFNLKFQIDGSQSFEEWLEKYGHIPLPHYIHRLDSIDDRNNYQTVYAKQSGSSAAPTAGFHFTPLLIEKLKNMGVTFLDLTLNIGLGTFRPVKAENIEDHPMHEESFTISEEFSKAFNQFKNSGKRIVAVGTTSVRALESWDGVSHGTFNTRAYIKPGYQFKFVDDLITNFHLPKSTLLFLVSAGMGIENQKLAYKFAIENKYRFFSYGDSMMIRGI